MLLGCDRVASMLFLCTAILIQTLLFGARISGKYLPTEGNVPVTTVSTVLGMLTNLPCNITPSVPGDRVLLVLWYKDGYGKPLYSFDLRNVKSTVDVIWDSELQDRVNLNIKSKPTAFLTFLGVEEKDQGLYRCRVDYKKSPTTFKDVKLSITVPPKEVVFLDEKGSEIIGSTGPFLEGSTLVITCDILGGWPSSEVIWWRGRERLDSTWEHISPAKSRNTLKMERLGRMDQEAVLECRGNNNNQSKPVSSSLKINLLLGPVSLKIVEPAAPMSVDEEYLWKCVSLGANPPPVLSWWNSNGRELPSVQENFDNGNRTVSILTFTPSLEDEGKPIICRAEHAALKSTMETSKITRIQYKPLLWLKLGNNLNEQNIKEGDDVYLSCSTKSNPPVSQLVWSHNEKVIDDPEKGGIIISKDNLIIRNITFLHEGKYTCEGTNSEGTSVSNIVYISISYLPRCTTSDAGYKRVSRGSSVNLRCPVHANPPPIEYRWEFNSSNTFRPLDTDMKGGVTYTPYTDMDYGSILCWGLNNVGKQINPCLFQIFPTGKPDPVSNCSIYNTTSTSVRVLCLPGSDNGSPQQFALQILSTHGMEEDLQTTSSVLINKESPSFLVKSLTSGTGFTFRIYSFNDNGDGEGIELKVYTLSAENQKHVSEIKEGPIPVKMTSLVWVFLGIMSLLVLLLVIVGVIIRISSVCSRIRHEKKEDMTALNQRSKQNVSRLKEDLNSPMIIHNNPDIIPDRERHKHRDLKRRNSYNSETFNQSKEKRRMERNKLHIDSMYCTLPKNLNNHTKPNQRTFKSPYQRTTSDLPILFEQNSMILREDSSAEDLTAEGRGVLLRDDPPPAPPEFADDVPPKVSPFMEMIREDGTVQDLNTTRF